MASLIFAVCLDGKKKDFRQMQIVTALFAVNTGFDGVIREPVILEEG